MALAEGSVIPVLSPLLPPQLVNNAAPSATEVPSISLFTALLPSEVKFAVEGMAEAFLSAVYPGRTDKGLSAAQKSVVARACCSDGNHMALWRAGKTKPVYFGYSCH
jgi:hypothetical protein